MNAKYYMNLKISRTSVEVCRQVRYKGSLFVAVVHTQHIL